MGKRPDPKKRKPAEKPKGFPGLTSKDRKSFQKKTFLKVPTGRLFKNRMVGKATVMFQPNKGVNRTATDKQANYFYRKNESIPFGNDLICLCQIKGKKRVVVVTKRGRVLRKANPEESGNWAAEFQQF